MTLIMGLTVISCDHKDLITDDTYTGDLSIVFDWRKAPEANPGSVMAWLFNINGDDALRYNFGSRDGGSARVPEGKYIGLGFNSDTSEIMKFRNMDKAESFEIYTEDALSLNAFGLSTRSIPRVPENATERIAVSPEQIWYDREDNLEVKAYIPDQKLIFYPDEITCHYTVTINDVRQMEYLNEASLDATVSGLSESYFFGKGHGSEVPVTHPVVLSALTGKNSLFGSFLTFGDTNDHSSRNILTVYLVYEDKSGSYAKYDVTDQVKNAPDPRHVDIVVSGLDLPQPINSGGGFVPTVREWEGVEYDLNM